MYPEFLDFYQPDIHEYFKELATKDMEMNKLKKHLDCVKKTSPTPIPVFSLDSLMNMEKESQINSRKSTITQNTENIYTGLNSLNKKKEINKTPVNNEHPSKIVKILSSQFSQQKSELNTNRAQSLSPSIKRSSARFIKSSIPDCEKDLIKRRQEIDTLKKEFAAKLGRTLAKIPQMAKKTIMAKISAALFGESAYEIEISKHAQAAMQQNLLNA